MYKKHGSEFKAKVAIEDLKEQKTWGELSQKYSVTSTQISTWKKQLKEASATIFEDKQEKNHQEEFDRLYRVIGQLTAERNFLEHVLKR